MNRLGTHNTTEELDSLIGMTIKGWKEVSVDYGHSFIMLETNSKFEDNETVYMLISKDAELNGGGYVGLVDKSVADQLDY